MTGRYGFFKKYRFSGAPCAFECALAENKAAYDLLRALPCAERQKILDAARDMSYGEIREYLRELPGADQSGPPKLL